MIASFLVQEEAAVISIGAFQSRLTFCLIVGWGLIYKLDIQNRNKHVNEKLT